MSDNLKRWATEQQQSMRDSAPDLYEALEMAMEWIGPLSPDMQVVLAALKKAKGEC